MCWLMPARLHRKKSRSISIVIEDDASIHDHFSLAQCYFRGLMEAADINIKPTANDKGRRRRAADYVTYFVVRAIPVVA